MLCEEVVCVAADVVVVVVVVVLVVVIISLLKIMRGACMKNACCTSVLYLSQHAVSCVLQIKLIYGKHV